MAHKTVDGTIGFMAVSVNLTKEEKNGGIIGTVLEETNQKFQDRCGDLIRSKFLLRDRLGSWYGL